MLFIVKWSRLESGGLLKTKISDASMKLWMQREFVSLSSMIKYCTINNLVILNFKSPSLNQMIKCKHNIPKSHPLKWTANNYQVRCRYNKNIFTMLENSIASITQNSLESHPISSDSWSSRVNGWWPNIYTKEIQNGLPKSNAINMYFSYNLDR